MAEINAAPTKDATSDGVVVTFITGGDEKTSGKGNKYTQAMATTMATVGGIPTPTVIRVMAFAHGLGWAAGKTATLKLKEQDVGRDGVRSFQVDDGNRGGGKGGNYPPRRPYWDMSGGQAATWAGSVWITIFQNLNKSDDVTVKSLAPDTLAMVSAELAKAVFEAANIAVQKPQSAQPKQDEPPPHGDN